MGLLIKGKYREFDNNKKIQMTKFSVANFRQPRTDVGSFRPPIAGVFNWALNCIGFHLQSDSFRLRQDQDFTTSRNETTPSLTSSWPNLQ